MAEPQVTCQFARQPDGAPICAAHRVLLQMRALVPVVGTNDAGLGHVVAGICTVSGQTLYEAEGL